MAAIGSGAADVVDRRRGVGDAIREPVGFVDRGRDEPRGRRGRPESRAQLATFAIGDDRERADRDHHRVARPDLHERLRLTAWVEVNGNDELVVGERILLHADEKLVERHPPRTADAGHLDVRALHEQRRQRVSRR